MADTPGGLRPEMGLRSTTFLIIGSMIGSGIFFLPAGMFVAVGSPGIVLLALLVGGVLSLCGALVLSELAAAYPRAGGQAVYIREAFGRLPAYLFTWSSFTGVQSAAIAAIAVAFSQTADTLWTLPGTAVTLGVLSVPKWGVSFLAVGVVWLLTLVNYIGVRRGALLNDAATVLKLLGLGFVVLVAFLFGRDAGNFEGPQFQGVGLSALGLAVAAGLFAYDGWAQPTFVASEVQDARRTVPRALLVGVSAVTLVYLVVATAYYWVVPGSAITADTAIAQETARIAVGSGAALLMAIAILVSTFGATNAYVLTSPRIYYDEAVEGGFPRTFGKLSRFRTPGYGLWFQALLASLLALSGTFDQLVNLVVGVVYLFYMVTAAAHWRLRRRDPAAFSGFRMPLWPLPYLVFVGVGLAVLANLLWTDLRTTLLGALLLAAGIPVYYGSTRKVTPAVK